MRSGSRSPRRDADEEEADEAYKEGQGPEVPEWDGAGLPPPSGGYPGSASSIVEQMQSHKQFLKQFMTKGPPIDTEPAPREFAAGVPLEAAKPLLLGATAADGSRPEPPWAELPAHIACLAAASRLFAVLLPEQAQEGLCEKLCATAATSGLAGEKPNASCLFEAAQSWQLAASGASRAIDSLDAMVRNEPVVCCALLDDYVAVLAEEETGFEAEEEVGAHCVMVVGGDISGPSFVVFDPWGSKGGEVSYWTLHDLEKAAPSAWVELVPAGLAKGPPAVS